MATIRVGELILDNHVAGFIRADNITLFGKKRCSGIVRKAAFQIFMLEVS